jgi:hypothetical protein
MRSPRGTPSVASVSLLLGLAAVAGCDSAAGGLLRSRRTDAGTSSDAPRPRPDAPLAPQDAGGGICASVELAARRITPRVTLVVDQSGSMNEELSGGLSRWDAVHEVLTGPEGLVTTTEGMVVYGLALYSDASGGSPRCPVVTEVTEMLGNRDAIDDAYEAADPLGETPTGDALDAILDGIEGAIDPSDDPRILVLATDGAPDRCGAPNGHDATSRARSVSAVERAYALGIRTFVVGVGEGTVSAEHLAELAAAGQGGAASRYYEAGDVASLAAAMREIVRGELSCTLELEGRIDPAQACAGEVRLNGTPLPCDDPDGWRAVDETHVELLGASCAALIERESNAIEARFPCEVVLM